MSLLHMNEMITRMMMMVTMGCSYSLSWAVFQGLY